MEIGLKENERIDDLQRNGYRIIQNRKKFCFGMDAVLLSYFAAEGEETAGRAGGMPLLKAADLGTGTGIIPLLLHGRLAPKTELNITGLEIQTEMADMARRSVQMNQLTRDITILEGDIREASLLLGRRSCHVVTSNPPYMKKGNGIFNPEDQKAIARHEVLCTFADVARETAALLVPGGRFYLVHRPQRLAELFEVLGRCHLEPKRMRMVHPFADAQAALVLIESVLGGKPFLKTEPPLIICREKGVYTDEINQLYRF